jgi:serine/threonine protein kinase
LVKKNKVFEAQNKLYRESGRPQDIKSVGLNLSKLRLYFIDMLKALYYCHKVTKIIHRDIKPENIGINHNGEAVLIDFGVSVDILDRKDD